MNLREDFLDIVSAEVRVGIGEMCLTAKSGHLGGSLSSVELMVALYFNNILRYSPGDPNYPDRDRVLVRGHLGPLRYKIFSLLGWIDKNELSTYGRLGSRLQGHEDMDVCPGVDITPSGSLGMLLSYAAGAGVALKRIRSNARIFVFLGDGEEQEGSVSEAARHIPVLGLDNVVCILDKNHKQLSSSTNVVDGKSNIKKIWEGYGWNVSEIEKGNSIKGISSVMNELKYGTGSPNFVIANTVKGKGLPGAVEHFCGYHTIGTCTDQKVNQMINKNITIIKKNSLTRTSVQKMVKDRVKKLNPAKGLNSLLENKRRRIAVNLQEGYSDEIIKAYSEFSTKYKTKRDVVNRFSGSLLLNEMSLIREVNRIFNKNNANFYFLNADLLDPELVSLLGFDDVKYSYIDVGIREQHLISMAHGISVTDKNSRIVVHFGDSLLYRVADQLNIISESSSRIILLTFFSGLSNCRNGSTHQSVSQPLLVNGLPGFRHFEPANVSDLRHSMNNALTNDDGPYYIRVHGTGIMPDEDNEKFSPYNVVYASTDKKGKSEFVIIAIGLLVAPAIDAAKKLHISFGLGIKVIKLVDLSLINTSLLEHLSGKYVLCLYNGNPRLIQSLIASRILEEDIPYPKKVISHGFIKGESGTLDELLKKYQFDKEGIVRLILNKFVGK